jgi:hypothetical protein
MSKTNYKLLINPYNPKKVFLREFRQYKSGKIKKRDLHANDLQNWTQQEFLEKLTKSGEEKAARNYIAANPHLFKEEEK